MDRKKELLKLAGDDATLIELVSKMLFLEKRLEELEKTAVYQSQSEQPGTAKSNTGGETV